MDSIPTGYPAFPDLPDEFDFSNRGSDDQVPSSIAERDVTLVDLENQIKMHHRAIAQCSARINSLRPCINIRLPRELLAEIFKQYMLMCTPPGYPKNFSTEFPPYAWLKVAHVCRYWRSVALAYPGLFTYLHLNGHNRLSSAEFKAEWLAHSASAPVHLIGTLEEQDPSWDIIVPHLSHAVNLNIILPKVPGPHAKVEWPICPLMKMVSCTLSSEDTQIEPPHMLDRFLDRLPNVEALTIEFDPLRLTEWAGSLPSTLRQLKIVSWTLHETQELEAFTSVLQTISNLQELEICKLAIVKSTPPVSIQVPETIMVIPSLRQLKLTGTLPSISLMLQTVACPDMLDISTDDDNEEDFDVFENFSPISSILTSHAHIHPKIEALTTAEIRASWFGPYHVTFKGWTTPQTLGSPFIAAPPDLTIRIIVDGHQIAQETLGALWNTLCPSLNRVEGLSVSLDEDRFDEDDQTIILSICRQLNRLRHFHLSTDRSLAYIFFKIFSSRHGDVVFPQLETLHIVSYENEGFKENYAMRMRDSLALRARRTDRRLEKLKLETVEHLDDWVNTNKREELDLLGEMVREMNLYETVPAIELP